MCFKDTAKIHFFPFKTISIKLNNIGYTKYKTIFILYIFPFSSVINCFRSPNLTNAHIFIGFSEVIYPSYLHLKRGKQIITIY